ncbi:MAG: hypothetical protein ACX94C_02840 [Phycisphaerales bacterium]
MKRPTTAAFVGVLALSATIGLIGFNNSAEANRTFGVETGDIASIDVFALVDLALGTDEMIQERTKYETETNSAIEGLQQQLMELQTQLNNMTADNPGAQALYQQYQQLQNQAQIQSQQATTGYQSLIARQISRAYEEIYAGANELAAEQGFAFVFATRSDGELLQTETITGITQEILARPLVTPPSATDLTEQLRVKLGYPEESADQGSEEGMIDTGTTQSPDGGEVEPANPQTEEGEE